MDWHPSYSTAQKNINWVVRYNGANKMSLMITKVVFIWSKNTAKYSKNYFYYNLK